MELNRIGQAVVTQQSVAAAAGVHPSTVSLALRNDPRLRRETRDRVREVAARLGYAENPLVSMLMARVRRKNVTYRGTLALVRTVPMGLIQTPGHVHRGFHAGARRRAEELGYKLDEFRMGADLRSPATLTKMLEAREIAGVVVVHTPSSVCPDRCLPFDLSNFAAVSIGVPLIRPALHYVANDQFMRTIIAAREAVSLGYRRPGLVIEDRFDSHMAHRCSAGFWAVQQYVPEIESIPILQVKGSESRSQLRRWLRRYRPDVVFSPRAWVWEELKSEGLRVPDDIGWVDLDWLPEHAPASGVYGNFEQTGSSAVDIVVSQIHHGERGAPAHPACHFIAGSWVDGATVRKVGPGMDFNAAFFAEALPAELQPMVAAL